MPKLTLQTLTIPQTLYFVPLADHLIDTDTVTATDPGVGTVQFWRDTPREALEIAATATEIGIETNTQEQGDGAYFITIEGVENTNDSPFQPLTTRFTIQGGQYVLTPEAGKL